MKDPDACFKGLTALVESTFPRTCTFCGKTYETTESFLTETLNMPNGRSSLKAALEDDGTAIVEVFRNCSCGSTLMDEFNNRRDDSDQGKQRRDKFNKLLTLLQNQNLSTDAARKEIIKVLHGEKSDTLDSLLKSKK